MSVNQYHERGSRGFDVSSFFRIDRNNVTDGSGATERRKAIGQTTVQPLAEVISKSPIVPIFLHQRPSDVMGVRFSRDIDQVEYVTISRIYVTGLAVPAGSIIAVRFKDTNGNKLIPRMVHNIPTEDIHTVFIPSRNGSTLDEMYQCPVVFQMTKSTFNLNGAHVELADANGNVLPNVTVSMWLFAYTMAWDI